MILAVTPPPDAQAAVLRLLAAVAVGSMIGINRQLKNKPAGLRTHALVSLGAALLTIVGLELVPTGGASGGAELSRIIQGIITGIGFLGAGVILRPPTGEHVHGLTTAASIWLAAALGIGCGVGERDLTAAAFGLTLAILLLGGPIERLTHWLVDRAPRGGGTSPG